MPTRRELLEGLAAATGTVVLLPLVSSCKSESETPAGSSEPTPPKQASQPTPPAPASPGDDRAAAPDAPPVDKPQDWDAIAYNKRRGNAGAIPDSYRASINGPDGDSKHLGKHLPYQPAIEPALQPQGFLALMWGDPAKGHAKHPNAAKGPDNNNEGHWYNWIKVRKVGEADAEELKSEYPDWPGTGDDGKYAVFGGGDIQADSGKNTIYLAALPKGVAPGDTVRIWAHCLTHGEYVDFLTVA